MSTVAERVGHASMKMTLDVYSHVSSADRQAVTVAMDKLMKLYAMGDCMVILLANVSQGAAM